MNTIDRTLRLGMTMLAVRLAAGRPDLMVVRYQEDTTPPLRRVVVTVLAMLGQA